MRSVKMAVLGLLSVAFMSSCVTYHGIAKVGDQVYLTGSTAFIFSSESWIWRCQEKGTTLICEILKVETPKPARAEEEGVRERFGR